MTKSILLIGHGAIAAEVRRHAAAGGYAIGAVLVRAGRLAAVRADLAPIPVIASLDHLAIRPAVAVECASHGAVAAYGPALLRQGIDLIVASVGALADDGLYNDLVAAAAAGGARLILPAGAVPGIDALSAARVGGLDEVTYTSRKPPAAWRGSPAEDAVPLAALTVPATHFTGTARAAAIAYPKNANVAAIVALAGTGFDRTSVRLVADPGITENIHEIAARGAFGSMQLTIAGRPLPGNPRTSSLAAYSIVRAIMACVGPVVI